MGFGCADVYYSRFLEINTRRDIPMLEPLGTSASLNHTQPADLDLYLAEHETISDALEEILHLSGLLTEPHNVPAVTQHLTSP